MGQQQGWRVHRNDSPAAPSLAGTARPRPHRAPRVSASGKRGSHAGAVALHSVEVAGHNPVGEAAGRVRDVGATGLRSDDHPEVIQARAHHFHVAHCGCTAWGGAWSLLAGGSRPAGHGSSWQHTNQPLQQHLTAAMGRRQQPHCFRITKSEAVERAIPISQARQLLTGSVP